MQCLLARAKPCSVSRVALRATLGLKALVAGFQEALRSRRDRERFYKCVVVQVRVAKRTYAKRDVNSAKSRWYTKKFTQ